MSLLEFPPKLLMAKTWTPPRLIGTGNTAGRSVSGIVVGSRSDGGGLWAVDMGEALFGDGDCVRALDALNAILGEGVEPIVVPFPRLRTQPWPLVDDEPLTSYGDIPFSDDTLFDDDTGFYQPVIDITLAVDAELRATNLQITKIYSGDLRGGEVFSIDHTDLSHRAYRIIGIDEQDETAATVRIAPPLREETSAGAALQFDEPRCVMQLASPSAFSVSIDNRPNRKITAHASFSFVESFLPIT